MSNNQIKDLLEKDDISQEGINVQKAIIQELKNNDLINFNDFKTLCIDKFDEDIDDF